jgi:hypothetical protein
MGNYSNINIKLSSLVILLTILSVQSCTDYCKDVVCQNGGTCNEGLCEDCDFGFTGGDCASLDLSVGIQNLLDIGISPASLLASNARMETFYGTIYEGGYIFELSVDGTGKVAALVEPPTNLNWNDALEYCENLVSNGKDDWFLPSKRQVNIIWNNLADANGSGENLGLDDEWNLGEINPVLYWSSTEATNTSSAWFQSLRNGAQGIDNKNSTFKVRAIRSF